MAKCRFKTYILSEKIFFKKFNKVVKPICFLFCDAFTKML